LVLVIYVANEFCCDISAGLVSLLCALLVICWLQELTSKASFVTFTVLFSPPSARIVPQSEKHRRPSDRRRSRGTQPSWTRHVCNYCPAFVSLYKSMS